LCLVSYALSTLRSKLLRRTGARLRSSPQTPLSLFLRQVLSMARSSRLSSYLPRLGFSCLGLCLASGVVLTFYYRPMGDVFRNVEEITTLVPYGWFLRQFHYASGQVFAILMLLHTVDHFLRKRYRNYSSRQWALLISSVCLCFFILFTGFILKGDKEGTFAGLIFSGIMGQIPGIGHHISRLFIATDGDFFFLPYLHHCFFLPVLVMVLIRGHIREWMPDKNALFIAGAGIFLFALAVEPRIDIPTNMQVDLVRGPWFFLGFQTLLKIAHPVLVGLVIPCIFLGCLFLLPIASSRLEAVLHYLIMGLFCVYGVLTLWAAIWGP
jgi:ubiquinol-cytochrome c reductase cytochrome b subunit